MHEFLVYKDDCTRIICVKCGLETYGGPYGNDMAQLAREFPCDLMQEMRDEHEWEFAFDTCEDDYVTFNRQNRYGKMRSQIYYCKHCRAHMVLSTFEPLSFPHIIVRSCFVVTSLLEQRRERCRVLAQKHRMRKALG